MAQKIKPPTLQQFLAAFPTEDSCLDHLFQVRFGIDFTCPGCARSARFTRVRGRRSYQCQWCAHQVYPTAGTPFDRTRTPLRDWFFVMFQFCASRNGVAAKEVERQLGVTYKTAWRMCHMIRLYMGDVDGTPTLGGPGDIVEIDETLVGGKAETGRPGPNLQNKTVVLGMVERGGDVVTQVVPNTRRSSTEPTIRAIVRQGTEIHTDMARSYQELWRSGYRHLRVNHAAGQFATRDGVHTQTIEGFWSQVKRAVNGTHIHVSGKHLPKYLSEFEYRWNMRRTPHLMLPRLMGSFPR